MFPVIKANQLPRIDTEQMVRVDELMIHHYGIELIQMMENAGRNLAALAYRFHGESDKEVHVYAGAGGNGGGGLVAARWLKNWGLNVSVFLLKPEKNYHSVPLHQLNILKKLSIPLNPVNLPTPDVILDAVIGYSIKGNPRGKAAEMIHTMNQSGAKVISLDTPSGLNLTNGNPYDPCVKSDATMTLALPKKGLYAQQGKQYVGDLYLADIGVPPELYEKVPLDIKPQKTLFAGQPILKIEA